MWPVITYILIPSHVSCHSPAACRYIYGVAVRVYRYIYIAMRVYRYIYIAMCVYRYIYIAMCVYRYIYITKCL